MYEIELPQSFIRPPTIGFIADLHFDHVDMMSAKDAENLFIWRMEMEVMRQPTFVLCVTGDVYDDTERTLAFIKRLETAKVPGFFVLGNHDYFKGRGAARAIRETMQYVEAATSEHVYFRVLTTGRRYMVGGVTFIGDTGWTSFEDDKHVLTSMDELSIPDKKQVAGLTRDSVRTLHDEWVEYASSVLNGTSNVVVLTHFPMRPFTRNVAAKPADVWWSSNTNLGSSDFSDAVFIFGHTHPRDGHQKADNHISTQIGYWAKRQGVDSFPVHTPVYDFGVLVPRLPVTTTALARQESYLTPYIDLVSGSSLVRRDVTDVAVKRVRRSLSAQGYRRVVANRNILEAVAADPDAYVTKVRETLRSFTALLSEHYEVLRGFDIPGHSRNALLEACGVIERRDMSDIHVYVAAMVLTGYVYNGVLSAFDEANPNHMIRPIHDYDVFRFWLVLISISARANSSTDGDSSLVFYSARASQKRVIEINGLAVPTPLLDDEYEIPTPLLLAAMSAAGLVVGSQTRKTGRDYYVVGRNQFFLDGEG